MFAFQTAPSLIHRGFTGKQLTLGNLRNGSQNDLTCHSFHSLWWAITISRSWLPLVWFASRLQTSLQLLNYMTATVSERRFFLFRLLSYEHECHASACIWTHNLCWWGAKNTWMKPLILVFWNALCSYVRVEGQVAHTLSCTQSTWRLRLGELCCEWGCPASSVG